MKVNYEDLAYHYKSVRHKFPGEWKDSLEAILDAVPDIIREHAELKERLKAADVTIAGLFKELKEKESKQC